MKKYIAIYLGILLITFSSLSYATTTVVVTEKIPGVECTKKGGDTPETRKYECTIEEGFGSVMGMLSGLIKYAAFLAILGAVLMLVLSGVNLSVAGDKEGAKKKFSTVIKSLLLLMLFGLILNTVAPWVYK